MITVDIIFLYIHVIGLIKDVFYKDFFNKLSETSIIQISSRVTSK